LIATTQGKLATLYPALILTLSNISPYLIHLGVTTASKLTTLFHSMSSPSFLMADESNFQLTCYLLELFNNIINYQYADNPNLIYAIVLHHDYFEKLDKLTLTSAVAEVERVRLLRESRTSVDASSKTPTQEDPETDIKNNSETEQAGQETKDKELEKPSYAQVAATPAIDTTATGHDSQSETMVAQATNIRPTRNGFIPDEAWMGYWKPKLPLRTVLALVEHLVPQVEEKCSAGMSLEELMEFLKAVQIEAVLPEDCKAIFIRKFQWGEALVIWFRSMMWGQNYVSSMKDLGPWNGTQVKLFQIKQE
jgi:hypothetical protein